MIESLNLKTPVEFTQSEIRERKQTGKKKINHSYHWRPRGKEENGLKETMTESFPEVAEI